MASAQDTEDSSRMVANERNAATSDTALEQDTAKAMVCDLASGGSEQHQITPTSAAQKVFGIVELTEKILASGLGMKQLFALKRVNKHFHNSITGSRSLMGAMWLVAPTLPSWSGPYLDDDGIPGPDYPNTEVNPFLVAIFGSDSFHVSAAGFNPTDQHEAALRLACDIKHLPALAGKLDKALAGRKHWHDTYIAEVYRLRFLAIQCYSTNDYGRWKNDDTLIAFDCTHDTVGKLLWEIRAQWGPKGEEKVPLRSRKYRSLAEVPYDALAQAIDFLGDCHASGWSEL